MVLFAILSFGRRQHAVVGFRQSLHGQVGQKHSFLTTAHSTRSSTPYSCSRLLIAQHCRLPGSAHRRASHRLFVSAQRAPVPEDLDEEEEPIVKPRPSNSSFYNTTTTTVGTSRPVATDKTGAAVRNETPISLSNAATTSTASATTMLHPHELKNGTIPYPTSLSPSSIAEFRNCPQSFLFQYLYGLRQPPTTALLKGSKVHTALERLFDLKQEDRSLDNLQNLFRQAYAESRESNLFLFESAADERTWGEEGLDLLQNYMQTEDPTTFDPAQREVWVRANLALNAQDGVTGYATKSHAKNRDGGDSDAQDTFLVRGIVDRLDLVRTKSEDEQVVLKVVDYKTGKAPDLKYPPHVNQRILDEAFFQLQIYALLLREKSAVNYADSSLGVRYLRLFYLTSQNGPAQPLEMDLGATEAERDAILQNVHDQLATVWTDICELVAQQDPTLFVGCDRKFCYCHRCRERFVPGTVWEPPPS